MALEKEQGITWINGTAEDKLERFTVSELCKGWPVYRDMHDWKHYRAIFAKEAYVWTTWSGRKSIDEFIEISKKEVEHGHFIMHRECGTLVDLNSSTLRAVGKMKATISQRFNTDGIVYDVDCDCYFIFFCLKENGEWKSKFMKLFYYKDKLVSVDGKSVPEFSEEELRRYPTGYQHLAVAQSRLGHAIDPKLATMDNEPAKKMWNAIDSWLAGEDWHVVINSLE